MAAARPGAPPPPPPLLPLLLLLLLPGGRRALEGEYRAGVPALHTGARADRAYTHAPYGVSLAHRASLTSALGSTRRAADAWLFPRGARRRSAPQPRSQRLAALSRFQSQRPVEPSPAPRPVAAGRERRLVGYTVHVPRLFATTERAGKLIFLAVEARGVPELVGPPEECPCAASGSVRSPAGLAAPAALTPEAPAWDRRGEWPRVPHPSPSGAALRDSAAPAGAGDRAGRRAAPRAPVELGRKGR